MGYFTNDEGWQIVWHCRKYRCPQEDERVCRLPFLCKKNIDLVQEPDPSFDLLRVLFLESSMRDNLKGKEWKEADVMG